MPLLPFAASLIELRSRSFVVHPSRITIYKPTLCIDVVAHIRVCAKSDSCSLGLSHDDSATTFPLII